MSDNLLITVKLLNGLGGTDAPRLDSLLESALSLYHPKAVPGYKIDRSLPAPPQANIPLPILRRRLEDWQIGACSDPILSTPAAEYHEHFVKKLAVEHAGLLSPESRLVVSTTNTWMKSHRQPIQKRVIDRICWFAVGNRRHVLEVLRRVKFLGKKVSYGNGRTAEWTVERIDRDYSWFAPSLEGTVLMRTLPIGDWLPGDLIGFKRDYIGVCSPYWHPDRRAEAVVPC
jgi:hypothetical protein